MPSALVIRGVVRACAADAVRLSDQLDAREQVAPLVAAAGLQRDAVPAVQLQVVHALQDLVAELGEADPRVAVEASGHRVLGQHRAQAVVLADVAQEVDRGQGARVQSRLFTIVAGVWRRRSAGSGSIWRRMRSTQPATSSSGGVERALPRHARVADQAGGAADERRTARGPRPAGGGRVRIWTRLPICRLGAVGSKPQYSDATGPSDQRGAEGVEVGGVGDAARATRARRERGS